MKPRFLLCFLFLPAFIISCEDGAEEYAPEKQTIRFAETGYGVCSLKPEAVESDEEGQTYTQNFVITDKTDTVPARLGSRFGINYMIESNLNDAVELRRSWMFPDTMHNEEGDAYIERSVNIRRTPNEENNTYFTLEHPYEIIKGKWQLRFYYKKHLLYRKIFVVI
jgi:hypothetical protein